MRSAASSATLLYRCPKEEGKPYCGSVYINRANADAVVRDALVELICATDRPAAKTAQATQTLREIAKLEARYIELENAYYIEGKIPMERFNGMQQTLIERIEALQVQHDRARYTGTRLLDVEREPAAVLAAWDAKGLDWQRAILGTLVERIEVTKPLKAGRGSKAVDRIKVTARAAA